MKLLELHCDYIEYEAKKKAVSDADPFPEGKERAENALVVFATIESGDDSSVVKSALSQIKKHFGEVKADCLVIYPYAHLSSDLADAKSGKKLLAEMLEEAKKDKEFKSVVKSPFGWYKSFELKCKGHPLAELSKSISRETVRKGGEQEKTAGRKEERVSESLKKEEKMKSELFILCPDGKLQPLKEYKFGRDQEGLKALADYEAKKERAYAKEPPHIRIMREHEFVDYEPASDQGHFRWLPKGVLAKRLLERKVLDECVSSGAMEVETPIMYSFEHPALKKYLNRFPARQYVVKSDDSEYFLRFAACFGQFLLAHDMVFSHKNLPMKMIEVTHYSFRREQSGELAGLKRLRAFTMPDMHTLCADLEQAKVEFAEQYEQSLKWNQELGIEVEVAFRAERKFFEENRKWYLEMARLAGKPFLMELFDERYAYFVTKFEFNFIDSAKKASALSTVQIDVENAETYGINFVNAEGRKEKPAIMHASISGSIERVFYALLEKEAMKMARGEQAMLPIWLSPAQLRIVPITDSQNDYCIKLAEEFNARGIRADVDDRSETLQKKIRGAEKEWIPFVAVVGEKETGEKTLAVRVRESKAQKTMRNRELEEEILRSCSGKPFERLSLPIQLSKRPVFCG